MSLVSRRGNHLFRYLIWIVFAAALAYLLARVQSLPRDVLQMDFTAFYTAGESLNFGLSPYLNHITYTPPIWDGIDPFIFSRFQYPPPAAMFFQLVALLPFLAAKYAWVILSLICVVLSITLTARIFPLKATWQWLLLGILICLFFPLLTLIERGQIDAVTLFLLIVAGFWYICKGRCEGWLAGFAIALAILLKVYCIFLLPFLLIRRRWTILAGTISGLLILMAGSYLLPGGADAWKEYVNDVLPRISYHNEGLVQAQVNPELIRELRGDAGIDATRKDGRIYKLSGFNFSSNASLVRVLLDEFFAPDSRISRSLLSFLVFIGLSIPFIPWLLRAGTGRVVDRQHEFLFWLLIMVVILLAAPLTWTMNVVWLLPIAVFIISTGNRDGFSQLGIPLVLMTFGVLIAALPDHKTLEWVGYFEKSWLNHKYVLAEILVLVGGLIALYRTQWSPYRD